MKKIGGKKLIILGLFILSGLFLLGAQAQALDVGLNYAAATGLGTQDIRITIANIIRVAMGLLGIVAVVLIILGGVQIMTAGGDAEKIAKAKKLLIGAVIGLIIILSAFAIASFVINSIIEAGGGGEPPPPSCEGCACDNSCPCIGCVGACTDPVSSSPSPYICYLSGRDEQPKGAKGDYLTIFGGKFLAYDSTDPTTSKVFFRKINADNTNTDYPAVVVLCPGSGSSSWNGTQITVEVPATLPFEASSLNNFYLVVQTKDGNSFDKRPGGNPPKDEFILLAGEPCAGIACIVPNQGQETTTSFTVYGKRFDASQGTNNLQFPIDKNAIVGSGNWTDEQIISTVPAGAISKSDNPPNLVRVVKAACTSNGATFNVLCTANACGGNNCCDGGSCADKDSSYCQSGIGESCDSISATSACEIGTNCQAGLVCDSGNCKCREPQPGDSCDLDPSPTICQPNADFCGQDLYCSINPATSCKCEYKPKIEAVLPDNGAPGNFVTIQGRGFGDEPGHVYFYNNREAVYPTTLCAGLDLWQGNQVVVQIPAGAVNGAIKLVNADGQEATWDKNGGEGFTINNVIRPGLCGTDPVSGGVGMPVTMAGINFGLTKDSVKIGGQEFDNKVNWTWSDTSITNAQVPLIQSAENLPVQVSVAGENSNPTYFNVTTANFPKIDFVDPIQGPAGQFVTIFGSNFGDEAGLVLFDNNEADMANWARATADFPEQCTAAGYWHGTYIIIKVPSGVIPNTLIVVKRKADSAYSNTIDFQYCPACALTPGICAIVPDQGPVGTAGVTLYGEGFGALGLNSLVKFWQDKIIPNTSFNTSTWTNIQIGQSGAAPITVPTTAITGPVQAVNNDGKVSNKVQFTVVDCRVQKDICPTGKICCQADGICKTQAACAVAPIQVNMCTYGWTFKTGQAVILNPPRVIESITCVDNTQSPTPWKKSVDNCINSVVSARFDKVMNSDSLNSDNIKIFKCNSGNADFNGISCTPVAGRLDAITGSGSTVVGFTFTPADNLNKNTWYQAILNGTAGTPGGGIKSAAPDNLLLDGNNDGQPGGNYTWYFKTRDSDLACDVDHVVVAPAEALIERIIDNQLYNAFALADNCNILNGDAYNWRWYKKYSDGVREEGMSLAANHGIATLSNDDVEPGSPNGNVDPKQLATPKKQGLTYIGAEVFWENQPGYDIKYRTDDNNKLVIDLNIPEIIDFYPKDGLVRSEVNAYVTISGHNFGASQGASQVLFDDVIADMADCDQAWSDEIIKVKAPKTQPILASNTPTYKLPAKLDKQDGMAVFYDFEESGNVIIKDQIDGLDGEIKGAPQRTSDQFGQALQLNGTADYIKLPNTLNQATGSLELWFKPQASGTLFSASNGTGTDLFSLDYIVAQNTAGLIKSNEWNYLVYTYDGTTPLLYVNGFKFTTFDKGISKTGNRNFIGPAKTSILIGAKDDGGIKNYFKGSIDGFAIYDRILAENEVLNHYGLSSGQVLFLKFEDVGNAVTDSSANGFSGISILDPAKSIVRINEGFYGKAISFPSGNPYSINIANDPSLNFNNGMTIEGWIKVSAGQPTHIFYNSDSVAFRSTIGDFMRLTLQINTGSSVESLYAQSTNKLAGDQWNYFAGTYDGQTIRVYLNGIKTEFSAPGYLNQINNSVCMGSCLGASPFAGSLDEIAVYNRVLSEEEIASRVGINNNSWLKVQTSFGSATTDFNNNNIKNPGETFTFSDNVYPFLCSLKPEAGLEGTAVVATGDNLGDSNKTTFDKIAYGVGSYVHFSEVKTPDILLDQNIKSWANKLLDIINPYGDVGPIGAEGIPVFASIDPYSEPYNDINNNGIYDDGANYADTNKDLTYNKRKVCSNNANKNCKQDSDCAAPGICVTASVSELASNTVPFYLKPVITSISPDNGPIKTWVTIRGYNFGNERGQVFFYNNKETDPERPPEPCQNTWANTQIIVEVPLGVESGDLYLVTAKNIESNHVTYTVNDKPLGAGLCQIVPAKGAVGTAVIAQGDRFGDTQASSQGQLVFTPQKNAVIANPVHWTNQNILSTVPTGANSGDVVVTKKFQIGQTCAGFHISTWCPSGQYDILYEDVPSNPVNFEVLPGTVIPPTPCTTNDNCKACGVGTSSCINGLCSPYIESFSPVVGAVGTWVNLKGCYFCSGSDQAGSVYFTGLSSPNDFNMSLEEYAAYYPLKLDANDTGPNHYDGMAFGTLNFGNEQLNLNGTNFVSATVPITDSFTAITWAKSATSSWNTNGWIASSRQNNGFVIHPSVNITTWVGYIINNGGGFSLIGSDNPGDITQWHQYGVMYNANTGEGSMIRDGKIVKTTTFTNLVRGNIDITIDFGHDSKSTYCTNPADPNCRFGKGAISEARIYNKFLSPEEIWALYASTYKGAGTPPAKIGYYKKALNPSDSNPECGNTWNCNPDGTSSVKVEVPNKFTPPNNDCPNGTCPPLPPLYDINDAVDGPIKLITNIGLSATTEHMSADTPPTTPNFDVTDKLGPNICLLIPESGPANTTVKIIGENLGDAPLDGDQVNFAPTAGVESYLNEPFFDTDKSGSLNGEETFVDINKNSLFNTITSLPIIERLMRSDYIFDIISFISGGDCPASGWEEKHICFAVPVNTVSQNAGGEGTKEGTATDDVSVTKDAMESAKLNFTVTYTTNITTPPKPGPKVSATVPNHGELEFCRNGIVDIYFDSLVNTDTIEKINAEGELVKNINLEACTGGAITVATKQGIIASTFAYVKNVAVRLFGLERQAAAQLSGCVPVDATLRIGVLNNKTAVSIIPAGLLDPGKNYRVIIIGGDDGLKNLAGVKLDNSNTPVSDPNDYIFEFGTLGAPSDDTTGICDAQWIDIKVYRTNLGDNNAEFRSNDLFTCAGKDDCQLENDYDQDDITPGNQHKYEAVAKYSGDFTLKANYQWSKNDNTDPQRAYDIYNNRGICPVGSTNYYCQADADCGSGTCDLTHVDLSDDVNIVSNTTGLTNTTAKPIKEARAQLVVQAQAERSLAAPAQRSFNLYTLMCENPWPSGTVNISLLIDAYNFHTYYCRDAGPPGPEGDLPAAKILIPEIQNRTRLDNWNFEFGNLTNWLAEEGDWTYQPVFTDLSGWLLDTSKINIGGQAFYDGETFTGALAFQQFVLEGTQLRFKIGGTNHAWPALDVEMPSGADIPENVTAVVLAIYDPVEAKFYIRQAVSGAGTNLLTDQIFDISANQGKIAIIKIYDTDQAGYIMFDELKQYDDQGVQMPLRF